MLLVEEEKEGVMVKEEEEEEVEVGLRGGERGGDNDNIFFSPSETLYEKRVKGRGTK